MGGALQDSTVVPEKEKAPSKSVAVIDVGTTSIRMAIAQIGGPEEIKVMEQLEQAVNLGKDTFTQGVIQKTTTEECVQALMCFQKVIREYKIDEEKNIRAVATSAVREASNRDAFLDRIYIATGIEVEAVEEAEVPRLMYLTIASSLNPDSRPLDSNCLIVEVGGGSTEMLLIQSGNVVFSHTYGLGSFRMRQMLESYGAPISSRKVIMENYIDRTVAQMRHEVSFQEPPEIMVLGGDARFAANQLLPNWNPEELARIRLSAVSRLTDKMLEMSVDELVRQYQLSYSAAESLGPALLTHVILGRSLKVKQLLVSNLTLRDGLLREMTEKAGEKDIFREQTIQSALELGRKFNYDEPHALHVADLSRTIFQNLQEEHNLSRRYELLLTVAAILHEIGIFIDVKAHHKHSMYLIRNSELFGLSPKDVLLVALLARYHRRATPRNTHEGYGDLDRASRIVVSKLAAILRVADALDQSHSQRLKDIQCGMENGSFEISVQWASDLSLEQMSLSHKGTLFEEVYGMQVRLRGTKVDPI